MNQNRAIALFSLACILCVSSLADAAEVDYQVGIAGWTGGKPALPLPPTNTSGQPCFVEYWGGVKNTCATSQVWMMSFQNMAHSPQTLSYSFADVTVQGDSSAFSCYMVGIQNAVYGASGGVWYTAATTATVGVYQQTLPVNSNQLSTEAMAIYCSIPANGMISHGFIYAHRSLV